MSKKENVTVNGMNFTLQGVSPSWYFKQNDTYGMSGGGRRDLPGYLNCMFKSVVVEPAEVRNKGLAYFDEIDDLDTAEQLLPVIERFLRARKQPDHSGAPSEG